ncbi:MAOB [Cordylochernes scorpioides]|uniref:Amine oxidase n=1 Tax=Cordylochernes scorpioides TaxID=51811 RepID=A0ABY6K5C7_9ARAC|nr:MAOB [Cordylochernes scorpioides]
MCNLDLLRVSETVGIVQDPKVGYVDLGGSYIGPTQDRVLRLVKELGIKLYVVNEEQDLIFFRDGKRWRFNDDIFPLFLNIFSYLDLNHIFKKLDDMGKQIPIREPWTCPHANEWDTMSFKEFLDKECWTKGAKQYMEMLMSLIVTVNGHEGSLLWFLWYLQQCGGMLRVISTTNGGQERKCVGGSQQISLRLADRLKGEEVCVDSQIPDLTCGGCADKLVLSSPVVKITQVDNRVELQTLNGRTYRANYVIMALSPTLQSKIHYDPPMPALRNQLMQRCPMGSVMKCILYYERPFWRDLANCGRVHAGFCGSTFIASDTEHPCVATFDDTKPDGSYPAIIGFNVADTVRANHVLSMEDRKMLFARSMAKVFGSDEALKVVHYEEKNWMEEQYSGGCYVGTFPPGFLTRFGKFDGDFALHTITALCRVIREPVGRIHYAGTETATHWAGYMEGAVQAGERAAREVLCQMGRLPESLVWQEEPPSQVRPTGGMTLTTDRSEQRSHFKEFEIVLRNQEDKLRETLLLIAELKVVDGLPQNQQIVDLELL